MVRYELWYALYTDAADICGLGDNGGAITGHYLDPTHGESHLQYLWTNSISMIIESTPVPELMNTLPLQNYWIPSTSSMN